MYQHCNIIIIIFLKMRVLKLYTSTILILKYVRLVEFVLIIFGHIVTVVINGEQR